MAYNELIKNFEKVRSYMRQFYVYGFKKRNEYKNKSARSYDDEKRRIEGWLKDYMRFTQTAEGKNVFLSVDSRAVQHNPFYKAWKAKSFTDRDITLHFIIFDILHSTEIKKTVKQLMDIMDRDYLSAFDKPVTFDESTVRKKLREYADEGIIITEKQGKQIYYSRADDIDVSKIEDVLDFFSETVPCGVVGSYLLDRTTLHDDVFYFKHHYITQTVDSDILASLFEAMRLKRYINVFNLSKHGRNPRQVTLVPLKIFISAQNGRQYLIAYNESVNMLNSYRLDYLSNVKLSERCESFDELRTALKKVEGNMWGVNCRWSLKRLEHVEFTIRVDCGEEYIVRRLEREKRCGKVEKLDESIYKFSADIFDTMEIIPWIRTFISRIIQVDFSNRTAENQFRKDIEKMYRMYDID